MILHNLFSCETQGIEEFSSVSGENTNSPAPWHANESRCVWCNDGGGAGADRYHVLAMHEPASAQAYTSGAWVTWGFYIRHNDDLSEMGSTYRDFARLQDSGNVTHLTLQHNDAGDLRLLDAAGSTVSTVSGVFAEDRWYRVIIKSKIENSSDVRVWVSNPGDPRNNLRISASSVDCLNGSTTRRMKIQFARWGQDLQAVGGNLMNFFLGSGFVGYDTETNIDDEAPPGPYTVLLFQDTDGASGTPDVGDGLQASTQWDSTAELPFSDTLYAQYGTTSAKSGSMIFDSGSRPGPAADSRVIADAYGGMYLWRHAALSGANGTLIYGRDGSTSSITFPTGTTFATTRLVVDGGDAVFPSASQDFRMGFSKNSGFLIQVHRVAEMAATYMMPHGTRKVVLNGLAFDATDDT